MITTASFPIPQAEITTTDPATAHEIGLFAHEQARFAESLRRSLTDQPTPVRPSDLLRHYMDTVTWRHDLTRTRPDPRPGHTGLPADHHLRYTSPLTGQGHRLLETGNRLRHGSTWDPTEGRYVGGGEHTPAGRTLLAHWRTAHDLLQVRGADTLDRVVTLPDGRILQAASLVRDAAADAVSHRVRALRAARGLDTGADHGFDAGPMPIWILTTDRYTRADLREHAMALLAGAATHPDHDVRLRLWKQARYLAFQGPVVRAGSDAVIRVLLVAVGAWLLGHAPVMPHDADLSCQILPQSAAQTLTGDRLAVRLPA